MVNPSIFTRRLNWIDKWNFATFYVFNSCDVGFTLYFETLWPALGNLSLGLLDWGLTDLARSMLRPKPGRAGRHGRRPTAGRGGRGAIPELPDLVRDRTNGRIINPDRAISDGIRHLWHIDNIGQKWTYRYSIIEMTSDFWSDWWTGIIIDPRADCPNIARVMRTEVQATQAVNGTSARGGSVIVYQNNIVSTPSTVQLPPGKFIATIAAKAQQGGLFPGDTTSGLEIWRGAGAGTLDSSSGLKSTHNPGEIVEHISTSYFIGPGPIQFRSFKLGETVEWREIMIWVFQIG